MHPLPRCAGHMFLALPLVMSALLVAASGAAAQAPPTPPPLDHYRCYPITLDEQDTATLADQFDIALNITEPVQVGNGVRLCNPASKRRGRRLTESAHPNDHLVLYRIADLGPNDFSPTRVVSIQNQFGKTKIHTFGEAALLVPTKKDNHDTPKPEDIDHFKCYRALGRAVNKKVELKDQFQEEPEVKVGQPFLFCNPTRKIHATVISGVNHAKDHLTCYKTSVTSAFPTTSARIVNQFSDASVDVKPADFLCVPTLKNGFEILNP